MYKKEAYDILDLPETAAKEEVKKTFKKLAAKYHPDVNKDDGAEDKFKKVNEAYQAIENNNFDDRNFSGSPFGSGFDFSRSQFDFSEIFGFRSNFSNNKWETVEDIYLEHTITFKESIIGCKKELNYTCDVMCSDCSGEGNYIKDNGCKVCKGSGRINSKSGNMFFQQTCKSCRGKIKTENCGKCIGKGKIKSNRSISVSIKPGITNGTILRLTGMGNFSGPMIGNSNVLLTVKVVSDKELRMVDNDVLTDIYINLIEAIKGCNKTITTIDGTQEIDIPPLSKNKEEIILPKLGVDRSGNERVIINVEYPKNIEKLIDVLEKE